MKNTLFLILSLLAITSCKRTDTKLKERISGSDSVAINFFKGDGTMDTVIAVKIIRDKEQIEKIVELVSHEKENKKISCGYDGSLHFFKMNSVIQNISFRMNDEKCMYFTFVQDGKSGSTILSSESKKLLETIKNK